MKELEGHELTAIVDLMVDALNAENINAAMWYMDAIHDNNREVLDYYKLHSDNETVSRFTHAYMQLEADLYNHIAALTDPQKKFTNTLHEQEKKLNDKESE